MKTVHSKDTGHQIAAQIEALVGGRATVQHVRERPWASVTFAGTRYTIRIDARADDKIDTVDDCLAKLIQALPDHQFELRGHFVADLLVGQPEPGLFEIEILAIADPQPG